MEAKFSYWILPSGLYCDYKLRASSINYMRSFFHHLKTVFVEKNFVRQLYCFFYFLLTDTFCLFSTVVIYPWVDEPGSIKQLI